MSIARQDFGLAVGTGKKVFFNLTSGGSPLNLTGASLRWRLSQQPSSAAVLEKTDTNGITILDIINGHIMLTIGNDDVDQSGLYYHALDVTISALTTPTVSGRVVVDPAPGAVGG